MTRRIILLSAMAPVAVVAVAVGGAPSGAPTTQDAHGESADCRPCVEGCVEEAQQCRAEAEDRFDECLETCFAEPGTKAHGDCLEACGDTRRSEIEPCNGQKDRCLRACHPQPEADESKRPGRRE